MRYEKALKALFWILCFMSIPLLLVGVSWPFVMVFGVYMGFSARKHMTELAKNSTIISDDDIELKALKKKYKKELKKDAVLSKILPKKQRESGNENHNLAMTTDQLHRLRQRVVEGMKAGEILRIRYWGGTTPGEVREILPVKFNEAGLLSAMCLRDDKIKLFKLEKIEFDGLEDAA